LDPINLIGAATVGYLGWTAVNYRLRLARTQREGLELSLLRRVDAARIPPEAAPALDRYARAEAARVQGNAAAREEEALSALSAIREAGGATRSAGLCYLAAQVKLAHLAGPLNLELVAVPALLSLKRGLKRFGHSPELHLGLAHAHAVLGQSTAALDELGRAVYYAHGEPFYRDLVLASEFVERVRPRLRQQCAESLPAREG
jgi:hypothetical protein